MLGSLVTLKYIKIKEEEKISIKLKEKQKKKKHLETLLNQKNKTKNNKKKSLLSAAELIKESVVAIQRLSRRDIQCCDLGWGRSGLANYSFVCLMLTEGASWKKHNLAAQLFTIDTY